MLWSQRSRRSGQYRSDFRQGEVTGCGIRQDVAMMGKPKYEAIVVTTSRLPTAILSTVSSR